MLSNKTLKFLYIGFLLVSSVNAADKNKEDNDKKNEKDVTVEVTATTTEHVKYDTQKADDVVLTCEEGYRFKVLKVGDKTLYTVDTNKFTPTTAHKLKHGDDLFFRLDLHAAQPLVFKKKSDKEWSQMGYGDYLDKVVWKDKKESKTLDASKYADTALFTSEEFGTGRSYKFKGDFKVKEVKYEDKAVGDPTKAKYTEVVVYVGSDKKVLVKLYYFYTGDNRFKEVYFKLDDGKWKKQEQNDANKELNAMNSEWALDYKPAVDKFSPLAVLSSLLIVTFAVFYYL